MKRRAGIALAAGAALVVILVVVIAGGGGGSAQPPATGATTVVPASALAYVHVSLDQRRPAVTRALALARRLPGFAQALRSIDGRLGVITGFSSPDAFAAAVRPWIGKEAAIAVLRSSGSLADSLTVLGVGNLALAQAFVSQSAAKAAGVYRTVPILRYPGGSELAFVRHYLVLGQPGSVRAAIDAANGAAPSLSGNAAYVRAASTEPPDRVIDAYASVDGVGRLLGGRGGIAAAFVALIDRPSLIGVSLSLSAAASGAEIQVHTALDRALAPVGAARPEPFTPTMASVVPSGATLMLDVNHLPSLAPRLLGASTAAGFGGGIAPLLTRLGQALAAEGVDVHALLSMFAGETAVAVTSQKDKPALLIITRTAEQSAVRLRLAALELPLEQLFPAGSGSSGQAQVFTDHQVRGITIHELALAPGLELDYAVFDGLVVVSTGLDAITEVVKRTGSLSGDAKYREALSGGPSQVTSLIFLDFSQLLSLGEQTGLTRGATFHALAPDLQRIRAVGLRSTSGKNDSTAELFLHIS